MKHAGDCFHGAWLKPPKGAVWGQGHTHHVRWETAFQLCIPLCLLCDRVINRKMTNRQRLKSRLTPFNRMWQSWLLTRYTQTNRLDRYLTEWLLPTWDTSAHSDEKIPESTLLFANHSTPMTWREMSVLTDWLSSRFVLDGLWLLTIWIGLFWLVYLLPATDDETYLSSVFCVAGIMAVAYPVDTHLYHTIVIGSKYCVPAACKPIIAKRDANGKKIMTRFKGKPVEEIATMKQLTQQQVDRLATQCCKL